MTKEYCTGLIQNSRCKAFPFHNISHTQEVVENVITIADSLALTSDEVGPVIIAAWFHDTGYLETYNGHEEVSCVLAEDFLKQNLEGQKTIQPVISIIMSTKYGHQPVTIEDKIIKDADTFHLSKPNYMEYLARLRNEWKELLEITYSDPEWIESNIRFLQNHKYYTTYGKSRLEKGKIDNLKRLRNRQFNNS